MARALYNDPDGVIERACGFAQLRRVSSARFRLEGGMFKHFYTQQNGILRVPYSLLTASIDDPGLHSQVLATTTSLHNACLHLGSASVSMLLCRWTSRRHHLQ